MIKTLLKYTLSSILLFSNLTFGFAQDVQFTVEETFDLTKIEKVCSKIQGISSIQYLNSSFILFSDRVKNGNPSIFKFKLSDSTLINLESFEYDKNTNSFLYSIENENNSKLCQSKTEIDSIPNFISNRGIESITISKDSTLWCVLEAPKNDNDSLVFQGYRLNDSNTYQKVGSLDLKYPFVCKSCFKNNSNLVYVTVTTGTEF